MLKKHISKPGMTEQEKKGRLSMNRPSLRNYNLQHARPHTVVIFIATFGKNFSLKKGRLFPVAHAKGVNKKRFLGNQLNIILQCGMSSVFKHPPTRPAQPKSMTLILCFLYDTIATEI